MKQRLFCLLLAAVLTTGTLAGCADGDTVESAADTTATESAAETDPLADALTAVRAEVDWDGEDFGILYVNDIAGYSEEVEAENKQDSSTSGSVINNAVHERNTLFEEYANLSLKLVPISNSNVSTAVAGEVQSSSGDFHLITQTTSGTANMATTGYLYDYLELDIHYDDKAWWDKGTLDFALGRHVFFMNGPFNIVDDDVTFIMMFNKQLREDYKIDNLYDTVKANEWTLSYFNEIISKLSNESNGDGKWDEQDTYGFSTPASIGNTFFYGAGLQYVINNRDMNEPELVLTGSKMDRALDVLALSREIIHDNHSSYVAKQGDEALSKAIFMQGRSLFYCEAASYLRGLNAEMDGDYGVVPIPKFDKAQEHYTTWSHSIGSTLSIPTTVAKDGDTTQFANVLELYTLLSEQLVRPAYYDTMLTVRNVRDAESAEMVDLIFQYRVYDMAMYFDKLGLSAIFGDSVYGADKFSSTYSAVSKKFNTVVGKLLSDMEKNQK